MLLPFFLFSVFCSHEIINSTWAICTEGVNFSVDLHKQHPDLEFIREGKKLISVNMLGLLVNSASARLSMLMCKARDVQGTTGMIMFSSVLAIFRILFLMSWLIVWSENTRSSQCLKAEGDVFRFLFFCLQDQDQTPRLPRLSSHERALKSEDLEKSGWVLLIY